VPALNRIPDGPDLRSTVTASVAEAEATHGVTRTTLFQQSLLPENAWQDVNTRYEPAQFEYQEFTAPEDGQPADVTILQTTLRTRLVARPGVSADEVQGFVERTRAELETQWNGTEAVVYNGERIFVRTRWEVVTDGGPVDHTVTVYPPDELDTDDQDSTRVRSDAPGWVGLHEIMGHGQGLGDYYANQGQRSSDVFRGPTVRLHAKGSPGLGDRPETRLPSLVEERRTLMSAGVVPSRLSLIRLIEMARGGETAPLGWLDRLRTEYQDTVAPARRRLAEVQADGTATPEAVRAAADELATAWQTLVTTTKELEQEILREHAARWAKGPYPEYTVVRWQLARLFEQRADAEQQQQEVMGRHLGAS